MITDDQIAAEAAAPAEGAAAPPFEDRSGAYAGPTLAADLLELREIYAGYLRRIPEEAWPRRTERRPNAWTLLETLAHLEIAARVFHYCVELALNGQPVVIPVLPQRSDLPEANRLTIAEGVRRGHEDLCASFLDSLAASAKLVSGLSREALAPRVEAPMYGGRPAVAELAGAILSHSGVVHGGQVAVGARAQPIWAFYSPGLMRRQLTRAIHVLGLTYWPQRGGDLHAVFAIDVAGQGGGSWFVRVAPTGGYGQIGTVRTADVTMSFASADLFCRTLTVQPGFLRNLLLRRVRVKGSPRLLARIPHMFSPT